MKRLLITGASGFIGSRLVIRAREAGHKVTATSRRVTPELEAALGQKVLSWDVLDEKTVPGNIEADVILHCATANDILSRDFAAGTRLSVEGTRNVLEAALRGGVRDVVFFSTLQVYGTELEGRISEATSPRCESPYGLNHLLGEEVCRLYANKHGMNVALVRPANVYGVPDAPTVERSTLVPMCFVKKVLEGGAIELMSSGRQQRNFVSTDEVADVCLKLVSDFPSGANVFNAGSDWLASIREIAEMVVEERPGQVELKIHSDQPLRGNEFILESVLADLRPGVEASRQRMRQVICGLFDHFARRPA